MGLTNALYKLARASTTGRAARRGPGSIAKRAERRQVYRATNRATRRAMRRFGL